MIPATEILATSKNNTFKKIKSGTVNNVLAAPHVLQSSNWRREQQVTGGKSQTTTKRAYRTTHGNIDLCAGRNCAANVRNASTTITSYLVDPANERFDNHKNNHYQRQIPQQQNNLTHIYVSRPTFDPRMYAAVSGVTH